VSGRFIHDRRLDGQGLMIVINKKNIVKFLTVKCISVHMLGDFRANELKSLFM